LIEKVIDSTAEIKPVQELCVQRQEVQLLSFWHDILLRSYRVAGDDNILAVVQGTRISAMLQAEDVTKVFTTTVM
jgi:hypothetical protein